MAGLAGLVMLGAAAEAKVYKWVDENGEVVFSQQPPPEGIKSEEIQVNAPPPATPEEKKIEDVVDDKVRGNPALDLELRRENCKKSKKSLELLESAGPDVRFIIEDGKPVKLSPEERALKSKEARAAIKAYCD